VTVEVTESDDGAVKRVSPGEGIVIRLPENPTTGYRWSVEAVDPEVVEVGESEFEANDEAGRAGAGGTRYLHLRTRQPGVSRVTLVLRRPWESGGENLRRFQVNVEVS
jgi:inhibitor of cysteine peptidase